MIDLGLMRVTAASPKMKVANVEYNVQEIISCIEKAYAEEKSGLIVFPELCITGYTCGDLFYQPHLYKSNLEGLMKIVKATKEMNIVVVVGFYLKILGNFYNCAALIQKGGIKGVVPKTFLPNYKEFYEGRWFASGADLVGKVDTVNVCGVEIPFGNLVFRDEQAGVGIGIEICEDLWTPLNPSAYLALNGADIIVNPSASNETVEKNKYRKNIVIAQTGKTECGYVYTSCGVWESTTDLVYSGDTMIAESGVLLAEGKRFSRESVLLSADIDYQKIQFARSQGQTFINSAKAYGEQYTFENVALSPMPLVYDGMEIKRYYRKNPFLPESAESLEEDCAEIFSIQTSGLAKRIEHSRAEKCVIGISGGLDSTLALLVAARTMVMLDRPATDIVAVTMPGFGTTGKTYNNALTLMKLLGAEVREIPIGESVLKHFEDIGHDKEIKDLTYENSQARERTQILMDISNQVRGLVVGTGDLSELALGWCTYNGDHMSMYGVNSGIPKTQVQFVVKWVMEHLLEGTEEVVNFSTDNKELKRVLQDILDTPISPELLPPDESGNIAQKTEDSVGPYVLHDFFIYRTVKEGMPPRKLLYIACQVFKDEYDREFIKKWLKIFYQRFFSQQFKRSCIPDGPKVGAISLSPRGDWRMPSDADGAIWLKELEY